MVEQHGKHAAEQPSSRETLTNATSFRYGILSSALRAAHVLVPVTKRNEAKRSVVEGLAESPKQSLDVRTYVPVTKRNEAKRSVV